MFSFDRRPVMPITLCKGVDRETNREPQSRPATLLALMDVRHNRAETMVCHNWK